MGCEYRLSARAEWDIDEIVAWYERQRQGLGARFLEELEDRLGAVCQHPEMFEIARGSVRRAVLRRFPYHVYYELGQGVIRVYCVCHEARHPRTWKDRLP